MNQTPANAPEAHEASAPTPAAPGHEPEPPAPPRQLKHSELTSYVHIALQAILDPDQAPWRRITDNMPCERCDGPTPMWWTPDWAWKMATFKTRYLNLCPVCFMTLAEDAGVGTAGAWQVYPPSSLT